MATQYIKYAKKCEKKVFFLNYRGGGVMASFGQGMATPMLFCILPKIFAN